MFVKVPAFSTWEAAGIRKTSVPMSSVRSSPDLTSGASFQNDADSISARSRTTSHFSEASARRCRPACWEPTAGFWPITNMPSRPPSSARSVVGKCEWLPEIFGSAPKPKSFSGVAASPNHALSSETMYLGMCDHQPRSVAARVQVVLERVLALARLGHREVAREQVVERRDVRRALDGGVPAQGDDAAARAPDVAEQELEDRPRADHLDPGGVVRPAHGVAEGGGLLAARVGDERLRDLAEELGRDAADALDHLGRVAREVAPQHVDDAARVLQRRVRLGPGRPSSPRPCAPRRTARSARAGRPTAAISPPSYIQDCGS